MSERPAEPQGGAALYYRGWEGSYDLEREQWTREGWVAYKGGCDLDAPQVTAKTWVSLLDAIDDEEDGT